MQLLTTTDLRNLLQLPERPYADPYYYDGTPYYDLSRREVVSFLSLSGTASGTPHLFVLGTDFNINYGSLDWTIPGGMKPDIGTAITSQYTYSRLGSSAASTSCWFSGLIVSQDLGPTYPYGSTTTSGVAFNDLAKMAQIMKAAHLACDALVSADIETSEKYRRGTVIIDDTKKSDDWALNAAKWDTLYKRYRILLRGPIRAFNVVVQDLDTKVFNDDLVTPDERVLLGGLFGGGFF